MSAMLHRHRWLVAALAVVLLVTVVGPFVYINLLKDDAPDRLTLDDVTTTTTTDGSATPAAPDGIDGVWTVTEGSTVGYRVRETLFGQDTEGVGRSGGVTGSLAVDGITVTEATFEVDMATFESDESRRDGQFENRIMEVDQFPTATFVLTAPIELGGEPADGEQVTAEATGELTLHGVTREVTLPLTARLTGSTFAIDGSITVTFADYEIDDPSGGPATVGDDGELEVLLVLSR